MKTILNRLRQPSSMAGLSALLLLFGVPLGASEAAVQIIGGVSALAAVLLDEKGAGGA